MTGVDSGDGRDPVLVVGPGCRPRNHHPVPLIGDNEYGHLRRQRCRRRPERREMHKVVGSLRAITHTNLCN
jgi:hypothetical protein